MKAGARLKHSFCECGFRPFCECLAASCGDDWARGFPSSLAEIEEMSVR
jgi:hypothetical protein